MLYDDGELNYSVDEHPDTVPQGSVDMSQVLEVTGAEQVTGHPHSLALTGPDRVTFVKAASREDARWWAELLAVFPRRHKRNATFPGGRASPSLPQLGRSASPQPPRPRHLSCTGPSPRANFTTPPVQEERERESPAKDDTINTNSSSTLKQYDSINNLNAIGGASTLSGANRNSLVTVPLPIEQPTRSDYIVSSGSPPTRDKLRCEDKERVRRDWRNERLRDIATALTDRSPESSLALPAEGLLHLKKGWLWFKDHNNGEWLRLWWVLCGPTLSGYKEQDESTMPEVSVELSTVTGYSEIQTETRYGFQIQWSGPTLTLSAVTAGIRSNWLQALKKAAPNSESPVSTPATPRSSLLSSDEEYRTASEGGGRRDSEDWGDYSASSPIPKTLLTRVKDRNRLRPKLPRCQSRQSTVDSVSTDELDGFNLPIVDLKSSFGAGFTTSEVDDLKKQLNHARNDIQNLEMEVTRLNLLQSETGVKEKQYKEMLHTLERTRDELTQKLRHADERHTRDMKSYQRRLTDFEQDVRESEDRCASNQRELQAKQRIVTSLQEELKCANDRLSRNRLENDRLYKKLQELEGKSLQKYKRIASLTDLTDIDLEVDLDTLNQNELIEQCLDLRSRFEKAVVEIRAVKRELRESHAKYDELELENVSIKRSLEIAEQENQAQAALTASRVQDLTSKLGSAEKQARVLKSKLQDSREKRRSLSLKGRENFSLNKEVEDKVTELEAKVMSLERGRSRRRRRDRSSEAASPIDDKSLRRLRRKSLDSATSSEPMKLLMRLSSLESKVNQVNTSNESLTPLNASVNDLTKTDISINSNNIVKMAKGKLAEVLYILTNMKSKKRLNFQTIEHELAELQEILNSKFSESETQVIRNSTTTVIRQLEDSLHDKLLELSEKKAILKESNQWDQHAKLEVLAQKMAFEELILSRLEDAMNSEASCERLLLKESVETSNFLKRLERKLNDGECEELPQSNTSLEYLTNVLTKRLLLSSMNNPQSVQNPFRNLRPAVAYLEEEQEKINNLLFTYKTTKLPLLGEALALETLNLSTDDSCQLNQSIGQTWSTTRQIVNSELITSEINHILMRTAQKYEALSSEDQNSFFTFFAHERAVLELWSDTVENTLRVEMDKYIEELTNVYQNALGKQRRSSYRSSNTRKIEQSTNTLLSEYADVIAHKALVDARILVLKGQTNDANEMQNQEVSDNMLMNLLELESYWDCMEKLELVHPSPNIVMEFKLMLGEANRESDNNVRASHVDGVCNAVRALSQHVHSLGEAVGIVPKDAESRIYGLENACHRCRELHESLRAIEEKVLALNQTKRSSIEERRPIYLGTEYLSQVESLRSAYRNKMAECTDRNHQENLEQLQVLSERVLATLESWHRRTLQDLRETHNQELAASRRDKEQALAEETQATLAALDAMRKAHEAEVQREVARFKQEFAREQHNEIFELNEQLSVKCLEAATLQEQLGSANRQLMHAQNHIMQLSKV